MAVDPDFGQVYQVDGSTCTLTNGSTTVEFFGTLLETQAIRGDQIFVDGRVAIVDTVTDDDTIELLYPWTGTTVTTEDWALLKVSVTRYDPAATQQQAREFLSFFRGTGTFYFVEGDEPDPGIGQNGQFALKINSGPWRIWYKTGGLWVYQGMPAGIENKGPYNPATDYLMGDFVSWQGSLWSSLQTPNIGHQPDLSPLYWRKELSGGDRFNIWSYDTDRPASAESVLVGYPDGVTFYVGLSTSYGKAKVAATATAVYSIKKNGTQFATVTFNAGNPVATIACPTQTVFAVGDEYEMIAPNPRDETLSGVSINIQGFRAN